MLERVAISYMSTVLLGLLGRHKVPTSVQLALLQNAKIAKNTKETQNRHLESGNLRSRILDPDSRSNLSAKGFIKQTLGALCVLGGSPFWVLAVRSCLLLLSAMLCSSAASAMEIWKFDKMAGPDQDEYIVILVQGSQNVLKEAGRPDDAAKVHKLFTTNDDNGISIGMNEFMMTLALARKSDADRIAKDPGAQRLEVEHGMLVMLKKNGIVLPKSLMTVGKDFKPKHAPQKQ